MAESSGVTKVLENMSVSRLPELSEVWKQVGRVESLKTRKQRLKDSKKIALNHYLDTTVYIRSTNETSSAQTPLTKEEPELSCSAASAAPVPSAGSEVSESTTAMNEEKCESEVTANSSVASVTDVETSEKEEAEPVPCGAQQIGSPLLSYGKEESLPQIDIRNFNVLKAIIRQFKQSQSPTRSEEAQEDTEVDSSKLHVEPDSDFNNSVAVDETSEDTKDKDASKSKQTAGEKPEEPSSDASSKTSSSMSSNSSVSTSSTSDLNKTQTEPSSSVLGDTSSSESVETLRAESSSEQETLQKIPEEHSATKTVGSEVETLSEVDPEQKFIPQTQSLETKEETPEEKDEDKNTQETEDKKDQILDTLDKKTVEQIKKEENKETEAPGPEKDLVSDLVKDKTCSETTLDTSAEVIDDSNDAALNQEETHLVKDEGLALKTDLTTVSQTEDREDKKTDETIPVPETLLSQSSTGARNNQETSQEATDKVTIVTRSTRGRKTIEQKDSDEKKENKTPTRTKTPGRDGQEAPKTEEKTPSGDIAPMENTREPEQKTLEDLKETEEDNKAATPKPRGRPRKTTKLSPVATRKSPRGVKAEDTGGQEGVENDDGTGTSRRRLELEEPEPKRFCSRSPRFAANFKLPPFDPKTPVGKEFVSRKWGFFCNLCSVSYLNETTTEDQHCQSQTHLENLQRYKKKCQQLQQKLQPTRMSTRNSQKRL